jgi:hypothetical protein
VPVPVPVPATDPSSTTEFDITSDDNVAVLGVSALKMYWDALVAFFVTASPTSEMDRLESDFGMNDAIREDSPDPLLLIGGLRMEDDILFPNVVLILFNLL